jgi:dihydrodipicolinate synthase/N-acetylneuraminate lyase
MSDKNKRPDETSPSKRYPAGILATCCIPWKTDNTFDEAVFRKAVRSVLAHTPLIYIFGTAGEGYAPSREQYSAIVSVFVDEMKKGGAAPMIGVIGISLSEILRRIEIARSFGAKTFQISLPSWEALNPDETKLYFREILTAFPDSGFFHYNLIRSGRIIIPEEYEYLSGEYPNLIGAKITSDSTRYIEKLMGLNLPLQFFFTGPGYPYASMHGECGFLISVASCNWKAAALYYNAGRDGDRSTLLQIQEELGGMTRELLRCVGDTGHIDGAYDKIFLKMHLPEFSLRLLPPYSYPPDSAFEEFREIVKNRYPRWYPSA